MDNQDANTFRYSQDQRRKECKLKKYNKLILEFKQEVIDGQTVQDYETELSQFNKKTLDIDYYKLYIEAKCVVNNILYPFYSKYIYRKLKLNGYMNRMRSEQRLMNNFQKIFGPPEEVIIAAGDFEQKKHMKFKEPVKGKGVRKLFRSYGYQVYLVDEHKTSVQCSSCENGRCENFLPRPNPRPYRTGNILVHGVTRCKNCQTVWNRDVNGATNIWKIALYTIHGQERPEYLCRT
jgi:hypothetical protein